MNLAARLVTTQTLPDSLAGFAKNGSSVERFR
jgi:hypothetical protein